MSALLLSLALLGQCSGGSCAVPSQFAPAQFAPSYSLPQFGEVLTIASEPTVYEMTDASGRKWTHRDQRYLKAWIEGRDAGAKAFRKAPGECGCDGCQCVAKAAKKDAEAFPAHAVKEKPPKARIDPNPEPDPEPEADISKLIDPAKRPPIEPKRGYSDAG